MHDLGGATGASDVDKDLGTLLGDPVRGRTGFQPELIADTMRSTNRATLQQVLELQRRDWARRLARSGPRPGEHRP